MEIIKMDEQLRQKIKELMDLGEKCMEVRHEIYELTEYNAELLEFLDNVQFGLYKDVNEAKEELERLNAKSIEFQV